MPPHDHDHHHPHPDHHHHHHPHVHGDHDEAPFGRGTERMWRKMEAMSRKFGGWSGPKGSNFGDWGGFGDSFRVGRMLASGDLRLVALYFIEQQPRHGYDLIKAVEEKTSGLYSPSPGVIYPALTFLEEAGYVNSTPEGNKRLYTITDEGRAHLADNREAVEATLAYLGRAGEQMNKMKRAWDEAGQHFGGGDRRGPELSPEVDEARRLLKEAIRDAAANPDPAAQQRLAGILRRAAEEIRRHEGQPEAGPIDI